MCSQVETDETFVGSEKAAKEDTSVDSSFVKMASRQEGNRDRE
jgi:hypothetical protein